KTQTEGNVVLTYHYEGKKLTMATYDFGDTTRFEYDAAGLMDRIEDQYGHAELIYNANKQVESIVKYSFGVRSNFYELEYDGKNVSKVKSYSVVDSVNAAQILGITYTPDSEMESLYLDVYESSISDYLRFLEADSLVTDGKINPYSINIGYIYMNLENPFAYGPSNIVDGNLEVLAQPTAIVTNYDYNEHDYPIEVDIDIPSWDKHTFFTYECY
ncbi:MAG: hypothetical protein JXR19_11640, partial [Bacteroidia bacterium]